MRRIAEGIGSALRCSINLDFIPVYPVTVNDPYMVEILKETAPGILGEDCLEEMPIVMGSEDFSFYQQKIPGVFCFLGMGDPVKGTDAQHHSPDFKTNDSVLAEGVALLSSVALRYLEKQ
jgi:amidohydrolase